jgi:hypothetical protein
MRRRNIYFIFKQNRTEPIMTRQAVYALNPNLSPLTERLRKAARTAQTLQSVTGFDSLGPIAAMIDGFASELAAAGGLDRSGGDTGPMRERFVRMRQELFKKTAVVEQLQSNTATAYRTQVGGRKEEFEAMDADAKKKSNPAAFVLQSCFHELGTLLDQLSGICAELMDAGGRLEHEKLQKTPHPDSPPIESYDRDPARPTLSP